MTTLADASKRLEKIADALATKIEREALPRRASDLEATDLSVFEALTLTLLSDASDGVTVDDREEKIALAGVIRFHAIKLGREEPKWRQAIATLSRNLGSERWRLGAALLLERPSLLTPAERQRLLGLKARLRRELAAAKAVATDALSGSLPANTPRATRFANDSEIAKAKAAGRVVPETLVRYGDTWFYADPRDVPSERRHARSRATASRPPRRVRDRRRRAST